MEPRVDRMLVGWRRRGRLVGVCVALAIGWTIAAAAMTPPSKVAGGFAGVERLPRPPLDVRGDAAFVFTGNELVVWGGDVEAANMGLPGPDRSYRDGAAFDPEKQAWRSLSPSPLPKSAVTPVAVMTKRDVVIARGRSVARWNPAKNTWRATRDAPGDITDLAFTGEDVISVSAGAVLDLRSGRWRRMPRPPVRLERATSTWAGKELVVLGGPDTPFTGAVGLAFDPKANTWRELPTPPNGLKAEALDSAWDGRRVVVVNYDMRAAAYTPETDSWRALPEVPARFCEWYPMVRAADSSHTVVFMCQAVLVLNESDRWTPLPYGAVPRGLAATTSVPARTASANEKLYVGGLEDNRNVFASLDAERAIDRPPQIQVGVATVTLPTGVSLVDTRGDPYGVTYSTEAMLSDPDGNTCSVVSTYDSAGAGTGMNLEDSPHVTLNAAGMQVTWQRSEDSTTWQVPLTTSDTVVISCDQSMLAEQLALGTSF